MRWVDRRYIDASGQLCRERGFEFSRGALRAMWVTPATFGLLLVGNALVVSGPWALGMAACVGSGVAAGKAVPFVYARPLFHFWGLAFITLAIVVVHVVLRTWTADLYPVALAQLLAGMVLFGAVVTRTVNIALTTKETTP